MCRTDEGVEVPDPLFAEFIEEYEHAVCSITEDERVVLDCFWAWLKDRNA